MKPLTKLLTAVLALSMFLCFTACTASGDRTTEPETGVIAREGIWADATYLADRSFGEGATRILVDVIADGKSVTFTVNTDETTLGAALVTCGIVEGENSTYGLYIKKVNGMTADYNTDKAWWGISKDGTDLMTGADGEAISAGAYYAFTYCK